MAYYMIYWEQKDENTHYALKEVRLKSINEVQSLALPHNRPSGTDLITVGRSDNQSNIEKIVYERGHNNDEIDLSQFHFDTRR